MSTDTKTPAPTVAELERAYDDLVAERDRLPDARTAALRDGDQAAFFQAEQRLALIDEEIADAQAALLAVRIEDAWTEAERLYQLEPPLVEKLAGLRVQIRKIREDAAANRNHDPIAAAEVDLDAAKLGKDVDSVEVELLDAKESTGAAILHAEELEDQYRALTGRTVPPGDSIRAQPPVLQRGVHVRRPNPEFNGLSARDRAEDASMVHGDGSRVFLPPGERPPRWAVLQLNNPKLFTPREENAGREGRTQPMPTFGA